MQHQVNICRAPETEHPCQPFARLPQGATLGGVWVYTDQIEEDVLGTDPNRGRVHTSMYSNLRTNLPREVRPDTISPVTVMAASLHPCCPVLCMLE